MNEWKPKSISLRIGIDKIWTITLISLFFPFVVEQRQSTGSGFQLLRVWLTRDMADVSLHRGGQRGGWLWLLSHYSHFAIFSITPPPCAIYCSDVVDWPAEASTILHSLSFSPFTKANVNSATAQIHYSFQFVLSYSLRYMKLHMVKRAHHNWEEL